MTLRIARVPACAIAVAGALAFAANLGSARVLRAQPAWDSIPPALRGAAVSTRVFGTPSGLTTALVFAAKREPGTERIWIGTEDGAMVSAGAQFLAQPLPTGATIAQVRDIVFGANGARYYAMRTGVFRRDERGWRAIDAAHGVQGSVVYSLAETNALDGTTRVVAGTRGGVCIVADTTCNPIALPAGIGRLAFMVRAHKRAGRRDDLWIVSAAGGAARLRDGAWTVFNARNGLTTISAEDIALGSGDDEVFIGGQTGVFSLTRDARGVERFAMMPNGPRAVFRVAWIPRTHDAPELWAGTSDGTLMSWSAPRRANGALSTPSDLSARWDTVQFDAEHQRGQVSLIQPIIERGETRVVYVGTRGGGLSRVSFNVARAYNLPGRAARDYVIQFATNSGSARLDTVALTTTGAGLNIVSNLNGRHAHIGPLIDSLTASSDGVYWGPLAPLPPGASPARDDNTFVLLGPGGPVRLVGGRWIQMPGLDSTAISRVQRLTLLDGSTVLTASTSRGLVSWNGTRWEALPNLPSQYMTAVVSLNDGGAPRMLIGVFGGVMTVSARGASVDSLLFSTRVRKSSSFAERTGPMWIRQLCRIPRPSGALVFASGDFGTVGWRRAADSGAWHPLPPMLQHALNSTAAVSLSCDRDGRLVIGGSNGLIVADVSDEDPSHWALRGVVAREDGLPSNVVTALGVPNDNRLWVGTEFGTAVLDLTRVTLDPPAPLSVRISDSDDGVPLEGEIELPVARAHLRVDAWMDSQHRESDARYVVELESSKRWWIPFGDTSPADTTWSPLSTRYFSGLAPGRYRLRVSGRDFAGREAASVDRFITILPPWWRTWEAIVAYIVAAGVLLLFAYRWRVTVLQRGTAQLVLSERRLRESENRFRALFEGALDANLLAERGFVVGANAAAASLFRCDVAQELVGRSVASLIVGRRAGDGELGSDDFLVRELGAPFEEKPVQMTRSEVTLEAGVLEHLVLRDMTAVRAAQREHARIEAHLRERQRLEALGTLAGGVAHDFNNLLGVIRGNAELADSTSDNPAFVHEHLGLIVDASDRARDLVRQILAFSQSPLPRQEPVDLSALVRSLQPLLRRMIPTSVAIVTEGVDTPHVIDGDPTQLQQVLLNLASNAEYAMRERTAGTLTIGVHERSVPEEETPPTGAVVSLSVRDSGTGMPPDVRARAFEPFVPTKPPGEGTGLGLAVLHGVVISHGGKVQISSTPGVGTIVELRFPRSLSVSGPILPPEAMNSSRRVPSRLARIMVVDDEPGVARVMERALSRSGHAVRVFGEPEVALEAISAEPQMVDLLLTDQTMPVMTGDVLAEQVRRIRPDLPVLIITGFSHRLTPERAAAVGVRDVLEKPISLEALHHAVEAALRSVDRPDSGRS